MCAKRWWPSDLREENVTVPELSEAERHAIGLQQPVLLWDQPLTSRCWTGYGYLSVPCMVRLPVSAVYGTVTCQCRVWCGYLSVPCLVRLPVSAVYGAVTCQCRVWYGYLSVPCMVRLPVLPWYNRTGWLGVKHKLTYLLTVTCQYRVRYGYLSVPPMVWLPVNDMYGTVTCQWRVWYGYLSVSDVYGTVTSQWVTCMVRLPVSDLCGTVTFQWRVWYGLPVSEWRVWYGYLSVIYTVVNYQSVQISSFQDGIYVLRRAHMRSTPPIRSFPNVVFETIPVFVWLTVAFC